MHDFASHFFCKILSDVTTSAPHAAEGQIPAFIPARPSALRDGFAFNFVASSRIFSLDKPLQSSLIIVYVQLNHRFSDVLQFPQLKAMFRCWP